MRPFPLLNEGHKGYSTLFFFKKKIKNNLIGSGQEREGGPLVSLPYSLSSSPPPYAILLGVSFCNDPGDLEPLPLAVSPSLISLSRRFSLPPFISFLVSLSLYSLSLPWLPFTIQATGDCWWTRADGWASEGVEKGVNSSPAADMTPTASVDR